MTNPETITVTLPNIVECAEILATVDRLSKAVDLAGELTPEAFTQWMAHGEALKAQDNETTPSALAGKQTAPGA